jgi:membrane-bound ClpP family serine protease
MCHIFLSFPILALPLFYFLPFEEALPLYLAILLFTGFLYFKIIRAMRSKVRTGKEAMIDEEAVVLEDIDPEGKVMVWSEIWKATANGERIHKGQKVRVFGFDGLTAIVGDSVEGREAPNCCAWGRHSS